MRYVRGGTVADTVVLRRGIKKAATGAASGFASGRGLECVHVQLEGALQVCGLVLVHDIVLGELVQHGGYLGKQGFGGTLLRGVAQCFYGITCCLVVQTVVGTLGRGLANAFFRLLMVCHNSVFFIFYFFSC